MDCNWPHYSILQNLCSAVHPREKKLEDTYFDRDVEKAFMSHSEAAFRAKTKPSLLLASHVGNMYTPSVFAGLASFISWSVMELFWQL